MDIFTGNIKIGISSCLLGEKVRFNSGHKRNSYIAGILKDYFDFVSFCPEVEIGLGIPRDPIRLVSIEGEIRCQGTKNSEFDVTEKLRNIAAEQKAWHEELCGYILKKDSPSCGMERVKIYSNGAPSKEGVGIYAKTLMQKYPFLPVEEEGRLGDAVLRENFIQRVFIYARWQKMLEQPFSMVLLRYFCLRRMILLPSHRWLVIDCMA